MDNDQLARINPLYLREQEYLKHLTDVGIDSAGKLYKSLDYDELIGDPSCDTIPGHPKLTQKCLRIADEARYFMTNEMIRGYEFTNVIELPCGYTPRGLLLANEGYKYVGLDYPIVISDVAPAVRAMCDKYSHRVSYEAMDATNFGSIAHALENVTGELTIVSELLLSYLTEHELISVCDNIYKILSQRGGCWITMDIGCRDLYRNTMLAAGNSDDLTAFDEFIKNSSSGLVLFENSLYTNGAGGAEDFLKFRGFDIEKINVSEVFPELSSINDMPGMEEKLRDAYKDMEYWTLTVNKRRGSRVINTDAKACVIDKKTGNGFLYMSISGRIDTITAPQLLDSFEESAAEGTLEKITIDCRNLEYISSAGLRVILIMIKRLSNRSGMTLRNVSPGVMDILETTGFTDMIPNITSA